MPSHGFTLFWQLWAGLSFAAFLVVEVWALCTDWRNTLSANVWRALRAAPGEGIGQWSALHFLASGAYVLITVWLFGHFFFMRWRS